MQVRILSVINKKKGKEMSDQDIDISGLDKIEVLRALYERAQPQGMGFLHYKDEPMTRDEAKEFLAQRSDRKYFDYVNGRVMKVDLTGDILNPWLYDRDNGQGAAKVVIDNLRASIS